MAHITGGGLVDNIERILPENCRAVINTSQMGRGRRFSTGSSRWGRSSEAEMFRTFNMGIGFVLVVASRQVRTVASAWRRIKLPIGPSVRFERGRCGVELVD